MQTSRWHHVDTLTVHNYTNILYIFMMLTQCSHNANMMLLTGAGVNPPFCFKYLWVASYSICRSLYQVFSHMGPLGKKFFCKYIIYNSLCYFVCTIHTPLPPNKILKLLTFLIFLCLFALLCTSIFLLFFALIPPFLLIMLLLS